MYNHQDNRIVFLKKKLSDSVKNQILNQVKLGRISDRLCASYFGMTFALKVDEKAYSHQ
jgi:hypothetical protein